MSLFQRTAPFAAPAKQRGSIGTGGGDGGSGSGSGGGSGSTETISDPAAIVAASYKKLDRMQLSLKALEGKAASMRELEELFELSPTRHTGLVEVRTQLRLLKMVWDTAGLVDGLFASWTATLWADIRTDELLDEARCVVYDGCFLGFACRFRQMFRKEQRKSCMFYVWLRYVRNREEASCCMYG